MDSFEYSIGHSYDTNFDILQSDFIPETDFETLLSAIQCEKDPNDILCVDSECNHFTNACTAFPLSPQLYEHNGAIDGAGIDIDIDNGNGNGTSNGNETRISYDGMDPNLYDHNEAIDCIGIDFDISSGSGSGTCNANDIGNDIGFYDEMDPNLYGNNEAMDGFGIDIDNGTDSGIGCYEEMDPNLYLLWDEDEDDEKVSRDGDSSETVTTRNPNTQRRSGGGVKGDRTKSLISERKRRIGTKEKLYTLRTLVPNISKMDKASIVGDATQYIEDLQTQARNLRSEIAKIEATSNQKKPSQNSNMIRVSNSVPILKKISKLEIFNVEEKGYYVKVVSNKGRGVAVSLLKALESITSFQVQSSNLATVGDAFVLTFTLKVAAREFDKKPPNLKLLLSGAFLKQGFKFKTVASP
ncbi:transcription factor FER-like iron deficiency-induced transcription factor-like protein [Tanacetum coccineum]